MLTVLDAGGTPTTLEVPNGELLGYTTASHEDRTTSLHRLDGARFAECGSYVGATVTASQVDDRQGRQLTLCWYCFPRG